ncbi:hypothetical protein A6V32_18510, partial [Proteus mirabilis]
HIQGTRIDFVTGGFPLLYDHSKRTSDWCRRVVLPLPDLLARAACTQADGAFHTSPAPVLSGLNQI